MKRVGVGKLSYVVSVIVWILLTACVVFGAWGLLTDWDGESVILTAAGPSSGRERIIETLGVLLLGGFSVYYAYCVFWKGPGCVLYNEEMAVFVLNRRDRRSYRWEDLRSGGVTVRNLGELEAGAVLLLSGWVFEFPDGKRMPVRAVLQGYREFEDLLARKGFLVQVRR